MSEPTPQEPTPQELLEARINELIDASLAYNPNLPKWYARLCVEHYIRNEEAEYFTAINDYMVEAPEETATIDFTEVSSKETPDETSGS